MWERGRSRGCGRCVFLGEEPHDDEELKAHGEEAEHAAFGAYGAAGEPFGAVENGIGEMANHDGAAVRNGEKIGFAPVEAGVKADGVPEIAGAIQRESKKDADERDTGGADETFTRIVEVDSAEPQRKNERGGPETDAVGQGELGVAAERKLFEKSDHGEKCEMQRAVAHDSFGGQCQASEGIASKSGDESDEDRYFYQSQEHAQPEFLAESFGNWEAVIAGGTPFDSRHDPRATKYQKEINRL